MMYLTAKVDLKKTIAVLLGISLVILAAIFLLGRPDAEATSAPTTGANDGRVKFLQDFGWELKENPVETGQVVIPREPGEVFQRYNTLQKGQGYNLESYAGKKAMRYVYEITNYPGADGKVYATILTYKDKIIGGDVTNTSVGGKIGGFKMPKKPAQLPTESLPDETMIP